MSQILHFFVVFPRKTILSIVFGTFVLVGGFAIHFLEPLSFDGLDDEEATQSIILNYDADSLQADQVISPDAKKSPSYDPRYGEYNRYELDKMGKDGDQKAKKMKKLYDQSRSRLDEKIHGKHYRGGKRY
jgi:hypothetical protein